MRSSTLHQLITAAHPVEARVTLYRGNDGRQLANQMVRVYEASEPKPSSSFGARSIEQRMPNKDMVETLRHDLRTQGWRQTDGDYANGVTTHRWRHDEGGELWIEQDHRKRNRYIVRHILGPVVGHAVKASASDFKGTEVEVDDNDIICYQPDGGDEVFPYLGSHLITDKNAPSILGAPLFHGSSAQFKQFKTGNIFLTGQAVGALAFASLGAYFQGYKTPEGGLRLYCVELATKKIERVSQKTHPELFDRASTPSDLNCQSYIKSRKGEVEALHFYDVNDAGVSDVWFLSDPKALRIKRSYRVFTVESKPKKQKVRRLRGVVMFGVLFWEVVSGMKNRVKASVPVFKLAKNLQLKKPKGGMAVFIKGERVSLGPNDPDGTFGVLRLSDGRQPTTVLSISSRSRLTKHLIPE